MDQPRFYIPKSLEAADPEGQQAQQAYMANLLDRARAALIGIIDRRRSPAERKHRGDFEKHKTRYRVVTELRTQHKMSLTKAFTYLGMRSRDIGGVPNAVRPAVVEAQTRLARVKACGVWSSIRDSYYLIEAVGGAGATLDSYLVEVRRQTKARQQG
jgi:hypothetical protein